MPTNSRNLLQQAPIAVTEEYHQSTTALHVPLQQRQPFGLELLRVDPQDNATVGKRRSSDVFFVDRPDGKFRVARRTRIERFFQVKETSRSTDPPGTGAT
jgi:hypothetical protein